MKRGGKQRGLFFFAFWKHEFFFLTSADSHGCSLKVLERPSLLLDNWKFAISEFGNGDSSGGHFRNHATASQSREKSLPHGTAAARVELRGKAPFDIEKLVCGTRISLGEPNRPSWGAKPIP